MPQIGSYTAWVSVENVELDEYNVEMSADGKTATCWIISEEGQMFTLNCKDSVRTHTTSVRLTLDGVEFKGRSLPGRHVLRPREQSRIDTLSWSSIRTSATTERDFTFSRIDLTDDPNDQDAATDEVGNISISFWRIECCRVERQKNSSARANLGKSTARKYAHVAESTPIYERTKKAGVHRVGFGAERIIDEDKGEKGNNGDAFQWVVKKIDEEPCATFIFRYSSLGILMAREIIAQPPPEKIDAASDHDEPQTDVKSEMDEIEDVDLNELQALQEKVRLLEAKKARADAKAAKMVKIETISHRGHFVPGEVIDLT